MPQQKLTFLQPWVLTIAFLVLLIPLLMLEYPLLQYSKGTFVYPFDEAYIRMATAKNLAFHGVWGLSGQEFSSASSSLLYPIMLAVLYKLFGTHLIFAFLINLLAALVCIIVIQQWLLRQGLTAMNRTLILAAVILLTPLPVLVAGGMEHMLQVLFTTLFLIQFCEWLTTKGSQGAKGHPLPWNIYILGMLMTATRYEGLFLVLVACIALLIKRRPLLSAVFGVVSILPVLAFGIYSLQHDAYFLPTSLMIKSIPVPLNGEAVGKFFTNDLFIRLVYPFNTYGAIAATRLLIVLPLVYWLFFSRMREQPLYYSMLLVCLTLTILHLTFANDILFFRYEAYLIACAALVTGVLIARERKIRWPQKGGAARWIAVWTSLLLVYPFFSRGWMAHKETFPECLNTYEQSYQAAAFLHRYYNDAAVIMDDIGVASWLSEGKKMDLVTGIGYTEIARSREGSYYRMEYADYLVKREKPALAIIRENKYGNAMLQHWVKVAGWYSNYPVALRNDHIDFYALDSASSNELKNNLQSFAPLLPPAVKVVYP